MPSEARIAPTLTVRQQQLQQWMQDCRAGTLKIFQTVDAETFRQQIHPEFSPVGWHLGHIAFTEGLWILEHCAGQAPLMPQYRRLFAADGLPKSDRCHLPDFSEICVYLETVRTQVLQYLQIAPLDQQERLWRWLLQHESQHCETISFLLHLQRSRSQPEPTSSSNLAPVYPVTSDATDQMIRIPAGEFQLGNNSLDAIDNEQPVQTLYLDTYWIDRYPVTNAQYQAFLAADGYENPQWWSKAGWQWRQTHQITQPLYWSGNPNLAQHPVYGVSYYEAEAYACFVGKRLPTEAEWEKAASWNPETQQRQLYPWGDIWPNTDHCNHDGAIAHTTPVGAYPAGRSFYGCEDMLGNVWEWTATWFDGYPGFEFYPYRGYSQVYFDGKHRVMRGGSWVTRPWALRSAFRNWYDPGTRQIFAGFRCVREIEP